MSRRRPAKSQGTRDRTGSGPASLERRESRGQVDAGEKEASELDRGQVMVSRKLGSGI